MGFRFLGFKVLGFRVPLKLKWETLARGISGPWRPSGAEAHDVEVTSQGQTPAVRDVKFDTIWGFPKIGDPNIVPQIVGSLL